MCVVGKWSFTEADDSLHVIVRSDGKPNRSSGFCQNGLEFYCLKNQHPAIVPRGNAPSVKSIQTKIEGGFKFVPNTEYAFEIIDDTSNVSFTLTCLQDPRIWAKVEGVLDSDHRSSAHNHIVFHNR